MCSSDLPNRELITRTFLTMALHSGLTLPTQQIDPMPVITGAAKYPENLVEKLKAAGAELVAVDALSLAEQAGTAKASNVVLMGVLASRMDYPDELWQKALEQCVPPKFLELNKKAFELGKNAQ